MVSSSRKIIIISVCLTLLSFAATYYTFNAEHHSFNRLTSLQTSSNKIALNITKAYLKLGMIIKAPQDFQINDVWMHIVHSETIAQEMLNAQKNRDSAIISVNSPKLRDQIIETIAQINQFSQIAKKRWEVKSIHEVYSDKNQNLKEAYIKLSMLTEKMHTSIKEAQISKINNLQNRQQFFFLFILLLAISITYLVIRYNENKARQYKILKLKEAEAQNSTEQLLHIINGAKLGYWDWNYKTGAHTVNDEWLNILGLSRDDISHHVNDWENRVHPKDIEHVETQLQTHLITGDNYVTEFRMKHADGRWVWIKGSGAVVEYDQNTQEPLRLCGTHSDITESKLAAFREKSRFHILEMITSDETLPEILKAIVNNVEQEHSTMLCSILLLDETDKHLVIGAAPSLPDIYNEAIDGVEIGNSVGSCGTAAFTNKRVIVEDIQNHPYWSLYKDLASNAGLGSCWSEPIRSTQGKVLGTFAIYHHHVNKPSKADITLIEQSANLASIAIERTQANTALKARDEQLQLVLAGANLGYWDWNISSGKFERNERWATMLGYSYRELQNTTMLWSDFIHPSDREKAWNSINNVLEGHANSHNLEYRMITKNGDIKWIHDQANVMKRDSDSKPLRMSGTHSDITERKLAEEKIKLAASVFTHARESIVITDTEGTIIDVNDTFTSTTGYSREESIGKNPRILKSGKQTSVFYTDMWQCIKDKGHWSGEIWNLRKSGEEYAEMKTISSVKDEFGNTTHYVALGNDITSIIEHQNQLEHIAHYDVLTHLPNRVLLADRLSQAMLQCNRHKLSLAVVFLDLDGFKAVNDAYGHDIGDDLLVSLSIRMQKALREGDSLARIGGDEFVAVLTDLTSVEDCEPVLERLLLATSEPITVADIVLNISASIGVTLYPQDNVSADQLMRHADQAMYVAKESGKNRYHIFDTAQDDAVKVERESLEAIRIALDENQFVLYYQPKVNMKTGIVIGSEALIRWQHPERGLLSPIEFLPVIENNPMMIELGEWVINTALTQINKWQKMGLKHSLHTSVNIAAVQLQQPDFAKRLSTLIKDHPEVKPHYLELEVLETSAFDDVINASKIMHDCIKLGVNFALDDFGTGYSSLTYLRRLPANIIKIDQSFIRDMLDNADDLAIVEGVIALAKSFKRDVIAEGVETVEHGTALLQLGCDLAQGYGIAKPMPASEVPEWINNWTPDEVWTR